jgi:anti-sigma B factor antagonist
MKLRRRRRRIPEPPAPELTGVEVAHAGASEVWAVGGEIDIATRSRLQAVLEAVPRSDAPLVVDLTEVTFMDSTGLSALLAIDRAARGSGRRLAIVCPEGPVRLLLAVTGVEEELPLYPTLAEALDAEG